MRGVKKDPIIAARELKGMDACLPKSKNHSTSTTTRLDHAVSLFGSQNSFDREKEKAANPFFAKHRITGH